MRDLLWLLLLRQGEEKTLCIGQYERLTKEKSNSKNRQFFSQFFCFLGVLMCSKLLLMNVLITIFKN